MKNSQWYLGTPNGVVLCVDCLKNSLFSGRIYHAYDEGAIAFSNMDEMVFKLEYFYNSLNFPYPTTNGRTFHTEKQQMDFREERARVMSDEELLSKHGDLGSFVIRVQHRQNSSWQGRITWMEEDKTVCFRSIWEMIKLITDALETVGGEEEGLMKWPDGKEKE